MIPDPADLTVYHGDIYVLQQGGAADVEGEIAGVMPSAASSSSIWEVKVGWVFMLSIIYLRASTECFDVASSPMHQSSPPSSISGYQNHILASVRA
ncbi:hypothetical protein FJTKL_01121 [Diaporthe vaccinii]|uniref:Uncharacterized protein n=1 Tax=Diaporthe vaccinii TaxID=105482 RepID=A0ABR4F571_9PEZI